MAAPARVVLGLGLAVGAALFALMPLLDPRFSGAGDAYDYALQVADYVTQLRLGHWPIFVGQSDFGFIGTIHTVRTAPAFTHLAGLLDCLTFRQCSFLTLQKMTLLACALGGGLTMAVAARRFLGPRRPVLVGLVAGLYLLTPGALAPIYLSDMYATYLTLPWVPLVFLGWVRLADPAESAAGWRQWAVGLGGLWWSHAPTATWASLGTLLYLAFAWRPRTWAQVRAAAGGGVLALALCTYVWLSVAALDRTPPEAVPGAGLDFILTHTPAPSELFSVRADVRGGDIIRGWQLGLTVLVFGGVGLIAARRHRPLWGLAAVAAWWLLLIGLCPPATQVMWTMLPPSIRLMNLWPAQRLLPLLAALALVAGTMGLGLRALRPGARRWPLALLLLALLGWSGYEARVYHARAILIRATERTTALMFEPEKVMVGRASTELLGQNSAYAEAGRRDPATEYRLIDPRTAAVWADGTTLRDGVPDRGADVPLRFRVPGEPMSAAPIPVAPGGVVLDFDFHGSRPEGVLEIKLDDFTFDYALGNSRPLSRGFGAGPLAAHSLLLRNPSAAQQAALILFWPTQPATTSANPAWATVRTRPWDPQESAVRIDGLVPATIAVVAPRAGWLESPKLWIPGYRATLDGEPVPVLRSAQSQVAVAVPAGSHQVVIAYAGSPLLWLTYGVALGTWLTLLGAGIWGLKRVFTSPLKSGT